MDGQIDDTNQAPAALVSEDRANGSIGNIANTIATSPIPLIDGLRDLQEMASREPNNLGALVGLAVAYSQSGQLDQALRLYRRMLGRRNATPGLWQIVAERLSDLEIDAAGSAQYHMARGDLFMRQGRMREAVEEYNRIV